MIVKTLKPDLLILDRCHAEGTVLELDEVLARRLVDKKAAVLCLAMPAPDELVDQVDPAPAPDDLVDPAPAPDELVDQDAPQDVPDEPSAPEDLETAEAPPAPSTAATRA